MQVDDICLLELIRTGDVGTRISDIQFKQALTVAMQMQKDQQALPQEMPALAPPALQAHYSNLVGGFLAYQHLGLHTIII